MTQKSKMTDKAKKSARDWAYAAKDLAYIAGIFWLGASWQQVLGIILLGSVAYSLFFMGFAIIWAFKKEFNNE